MILFSSINTENTEKIVVTGRSSCWKQTNKKKNKFDYYEAFLILYRYSSLVSVPEVVVQK